ncbi:Maintenance of telomere capping protein [Trichinella pseudospiralis]
MSVRDMADPWSSKNGSNWSDCAKGGFISLLIFYYLTQNLHVQKHTTNKTWKKIDVYVVKWPVTVCAKVELDSEGKTESSKQVNALGAKRQISARKIKAAALRFIGRQKATFIGQCRGVQALAPPLLL